MRRYPLQATMRIAAAVLLLASCTSGPNAQLGDLCFADSECESGRCDESVCKARAAPGAPCEHPLQCLSERCVDGYCAAGLRGPGAPCSHDTQCVGGQCISDTCDGVKPDDAGVDAAPDISWEPIPAVWCRTLGGGRSEELSKLAVDPSGNVYLLGLFDEETLALGSDTLTNATGSDQLFVASYSPDGTYRWSHTLEGSGYDIAADATNVYLATSVGGPVLTALSHAGEPRWSKSWVPSSGASFQLTAGPSGTLYAAGSLKGTLDFGDGQVSSISNSDIFVAAFTPTSGAHRWSKAFEGYPYCPPGSLCRVVGTTEFVNSVVEHEGQLYLTGSFQAGIDFGGGMLHAAGESNDTDIYLASLTGNGEHRWSARYGDIGSETGWSLDVGSSGNIYLAGSYTVGSPSAVTNSEAGFGGSAVFPASDDSSNDVAVAGYSPTGAYRWSKRLGGWGSDDPVGLGLDADDNVFVAGSFSGKLEHDRGSLSSIGGGDDIFIASYAPDGDLRFVVQYGGKANEKLAGFVVDANKQHMLLAGTFAGTADFGCGPQTAEGEWDGFVVKLPLR